jgi:hypothetical protein
MLATACVVFFTCFSCKENASLKSRSNWYTLNDLVDDTSDLTLHNMLIANIEKSLAENPTVNGNLAGYGVSKQLNDYCSLKKLCTTNHLVELTNSKCIALRAYAFLALVDMRYAGLPGILEEHLTDTARFNYQSGCMINPKAINLFYLQALQSLLEEASFKRYMKIVAKQFHPEEWRSMMMTEIYYDWPYDWQIEYKK